MLQLQIPINDEANDLLLKGYVKRLLTVIEKDIQLKANRKKYELREPYVIQYFIKWNNKIPKSIDLIQYITHCLRLRKERGYYIIELDDRQRVTGSTTLVKDLVRLLEYGNEKLPAYPLIRNTLSYYQEHWEDEFGKVLERTLI